MKIYLVNGFLGSGKTTAIQQAIAHFRNKHIRAGVITNDQGRQLVDSKFFESSGIPTCEVTDGCFCCKYEQLDAHLVSWEESHSMDVIFAESVGSCTDLVATVVRPLMHYHPHIKVQMSVFVDACILPVLMQKESFFFDEEVHYIYRKQIEEADVLVINKTDLLDDRQLQEVKALVNTLYPQKKVLYQSSFLQKDIEGWLDTFNQQDPKDRQTLNIDYEIYGAGEAKLGWLDAELVIKTPADYAWEAAYSLIDKMKSTITEALLPVGHLKFFMDDGKEHQKISFTSVGNGTISRKKLEASALTMLINARVQAIPDRLQQILKGVITEIQINQAVQVITKEVATFQPGFPQPVHKVVS